MTSIIATIYASSTLTKPSKGGRIQKTPILLTTYKLLRQISHKGENEKCRTFVKKQKQKKTKIKFMIKISSKC